MPTRWGMPCRRSNGSILVSPPASFVNLFVGETSARFMDGLNTPIEDGAIISIIPAVAGG
jgi:molybdopterin converting factor small subunit